MSSWSSICTQGPLSSSKGKLKAIAYRDILYHSWLPTLWQQLGKERCKELWWSSDQIFLFIQHMCIQPWTWTCFTVCRCMCVSFFSFRRTQRLIWPLIFVCLRLKERQRKVLLYPLSSVKKSKINYWCRLKLYCFFFILLISWSA